MGVSISHPLKRTTKAKYIQTLDGGSSVFDETEQFFSQSLHPENNKGETSRGTKGFSKRNEPGFFQFKGARGNSRCPFDSLDTIDSRKSVPFAVLPENNTQASTSSPNGEGGFVSVPSDSETISVEKSGQLLFLDEVEDDLEDGSSAQKGAGAKLKERNTPNPAEYVHEEVIAPLQGKLRRKDRASSTTRSGEEAHLPDRNHGNSTHSRRCAENSSNMSVTHEECADGKASEQEVTRMIRADSETEMVCFSNQYKLSPRHSS